jgi:bifunctional non-homologous end joining protein LigD
MTGELGTYRSRRDPARTPEPVPPEGKLPGGRDNRFVIQEHHARSLHWDFRLERGGVLVSWAVPKGLPTHPQRNHLAVHTEDHPLEYAGFAGEIPRGEYGAGTVTIWDRGTYECEKWTEREVMVRLHGERVHGRYVLFQTRDRNWMVHRMDPAEPETEPLPELVRPMLAVAGRLPDDETGWAFEFKWDGIRAVAYVSGGRLRLLTRNDRDVTATYPELRALGRALGARAVILDGEIVALDEAGRPSFAALQPRMHVTNPAQVRRLAARTPVVYLAFDVLHLDGRSTVEVPYRERRLLLEDLRLSGPAWQTPPSFAGPGKDLLAASLSRGLEGVLAKRLDSRYQPGRRSDAWVKVKNFQTQEVVVGGWKAGTGRRAGRIGSLLVGVPGPDGLRYAGHVGTGFTDPMLDELGQLLRPLGRKTSPFVDAVLPASHARSAVWVQPQLVGEVVFTEWTRDGRLRHPSWRGLRPDKSAEEVVRET